MPPEEELPSLVLEEGQELELSSESIEQFAFAMMKEIESFEDIRNIAFAQAWQSQMEDARVTSESGYMLVPQSNIVDWARRVGGILGLELADFIVPAGSKVTLNNPLNEIRARNVVIGGTLECRGHLSIICQELRGG